MTHKAIAKIEKQYIRKDLPAFKVGDTVEVDVLIREGERQRHQKYRGLVIAMGGSGARKMFTVRKISYGVGVEKQFPLSSPNVSEIKVLKHGSARRSKLYYLRGRVGKLALKVKPGQPAPVVEHEEEAQEVLEPTMELAPAYNADTAGPTEIAETEAASVESAEEVSDSSEASESDAATA